MPTTVFFGSNRQLTGAPELVASYGAPMQPPSVSTNLVYGTAFVSGTQVAANVPGQIDSIQNARQPVPAATREDGPDFGIVDCGIQLIGSRLICARQIARLPFYPFGYSDMIARVLQTPRILPDARDPDRSRRRDEGNGVAGL